MKDFEFLSWLSHEWFTLERLLSYTWDHKVLLFIIPFVPLVFLIKWLFQVRFRQRPDIALAPGKISLLSKGAWLRHIPGSVLFCAISLILVALARPRVVTHSNNSYAEGIDIMLVFDVSESMLLEDLRPNRLEAAKTVASDFIQNRPDDRIGLIAFSTDALSITPLTQDLGLVSQYLKEMNTDLLDGSGTAIGNAIAIGINRMREVYGSSKVMILLSDGENTAGNLDPITAAELASAFGIHIYTIAIGKEGKVNYTDPNTGIRLEVDSHLDETTLRTVADITNGRFFRATDIKQLSTIFGEIDKYEKQEYVHSTTTETEDYYQVYLAWSVLFFLLWLATKSTFLTNALED